MKAAESIKTIPMVPSIEDLPFPAFPDRAGDGLRESGNVPSVEPGTMLSRE